MPRPTPFRLVFEHIAPESFPGIRDALERSGTDDRDRDAFLMQREVVTVLRELRPDEGIGEGIDRLAALLHHAYLFWAAGGQVIDILDPKLLGILDRTAEPRAAGFDPPPACYIRMPERRIWAEVLPGQPHEPLDGCFIHATADEETLRVLGVFGVHPDRAGFSVVEAVGHRVNNLARVDGSRIFASTLPGGSRAGLFSLAGEEELLELGWRTRAAAAVMAVGASGWTA
jgi:hypothetical protein